ncbi:MAG TPA: ATP-binding cassette domain-containing protein, partial [Ginsengibacter sp.]|nr:ATP-binding cassette domain-containing protein [Ginsengibacter sp.]
MRINFSIDQNPGKVLCTLKHATKSFGKIKIVEDTSVEINRGDKIALIGANGKGKSTLLRMIAGTEPFEGERIPGHNVKQSFYAQHQLEALNLEHNVLEELSYSGSGKTDLELRTLLGCFLFSGDDVDKKIRILSGGEKARVALAKTIISKGNFLLLDEPTNHLDMHSVELLIEALQKYEGSYLLVSHDRYFVSKTANKIWEIQDLKVKEFAGGYEEWEQWKKDHQKPERRVEKAETKEKKEVTRKSASQQQEKERQRELQKIKKQFEQTEKALEKINAEKATLENLLASPDIYSDAGKFAETEKRYQELSRLSEKENQKYETLFEEIMRLEGEE